MSGASLILNLQLASTNADSRRLQPLFEQQSILALGLAGATKKFKRHFEWR